ncbi:MAG: peptidylprolyl isomerase [Ekhidna sp.]|nr:peptidylprolyl isomerase [Ekhidna sp.]
MKNSLLFLILLSFAVSCKPPEQEESIPVPSRVALTTEVGEIIIELSDRTPLHRDNFLKLVESGAYDSILFHRVISDFVVQAGERDSSNYQSSDSIELDYTVPAEFDSTLFHKRGAIGAARDGNPARASSSIQFYIVQRGPRADSLIDKDEKRINKWLSENKTVNAQENTALKDSLAKAMEANDMEVYSQLADSISKLAELIEFEAYKIPISQRKIYNSLGGTPHLDQNYTVFGEVVEGMNVVDSIAMKRVNDQGRPLKKIYIISATVVE